jgi:light-harvesting protein B-800-850 alpha chain
MIYGKIWCVVKPTVGIPLFLGSVALTSLFVHYHLLQATGWLKTYYMGKTKTAMIESSTPTAAAPASDTVLVARATTK